MAVVKDYTNPGLVGWTSPAGVVSVVVEAWGGGGGGGGSGNGDRHSDGSGGGGGGGAYVIATVAISGNTTYNIYVGDRGAARIGNDTGGHPIASGDGGDSSFEKLNGTK